METAKQIVSQHLVMKAGETFPRCIHKTTKKTPNLNPEGKVAAAGLNLLQFAPVCWRSCTLQISFLFLLYVPGFQSGRSRAYVCLKS